MFEKTQDIISEQLNIDKEMITLETSLKNDLGADSLDLFELVMALEDEYQLEIPYEDLEKIETVSDVIDYLKSQNRT